MQLRLDFEFRFFGQGILGQLHRNQIRVLRLGFSAEKTFTPMSRKVTWVSRRILRGHKKPVAQPPTFMPEEGSTPFVIKFLLLLLNLYSVYSSTPCTLPCTSFVLQCTLHRRVLYVL